MNNKWKPKQAVERWPWDPPEPVTITADGGPKFKIGQRVAVAIPGGAIYGELRAIDDELAIVRINGQSERVPLDIISGA